MGFFKGISKSINIVCKVQVINHFPKVSARSSGRCGKAVDSLSLPHYETADNDEQKGDRHSPLKESSDDIKFFSQMAIKTYTALLKLVYRAIALSTYGSGSQVLFVI